jgi:hypothetical protein
MLLSLQVLRRVGIATFLEAWVCYRGDENQDTRNRDVAQFTGAQFTPEQ